MSTLAQLEAEHARARDAARAARERLRTAQRAAVDAINKHADVHARVVGGAGTREDVVRAEKERDEAIAALDAVKAELGRG